MTSVDAASVQPNDSRKPLEAMQPLRVLALGAATLAYVSALPMGCALSSLIDDRPSLTKVSD